MSGIYHGGGLDAAIARFGGTRADWLDLSTGINPVPYPVGEIAFDAWARLPDRGAEARLLDAARTYYNVPKSSELVVGNGTQAIIEILPYVLDAKHVAIISPTYGEHSHVWGKSVRKITEISSLSDIPKDADVLVVVNPNNPDARSWQPAELLEAAKQVSHLIVDEAFCDAYQANSLVAKMPDNAIILRSFGKFFGLAGLRLGFAIANTEIAEKIVDRLGPWAVSGPALAIGTKAFLDTKWIDETRNTLEAKSKALANILQSHNFDIAGRNALFVYVSHDQAKAIFNHLAERHVLVRPFETLPDKLRFGLCANEAELSRLKTALACYE